MLGRGSRCDAPLRIPQVPSAPSRPLGAGLAHGGLGDGVSPLWRAFAPVRLPGADTGGLGGSPERSPSPFMFEVAPEGQKEVAQTTGGFLWSYRASNVYLVYFNSKGLLFIR